MGRGKAELEHSAHQQSVGMGVGEDGSGPSGAPRSN